MARRIPMGQLQRFYKRLHDLYQRYPQRWTKEKGYSDADYYLHQTVKLLKGLKAGLEGKPLPGTEAPEFRRPMQRIPPQPDYRRFQREEEAYDQYAPEEDGMYEQEQYVPSVPRKITMSTGGSRFVPKSTRSKSRSVRPSFLRKR